MSQLTIRPARRLSGRVRVPGDKSISHRSLLLGALAQGESHVRGFLRSGDCQATLRCLRALGIEIEELDETTLIVHGRGLYGLSAPDGPLDCGRSGTTMRLLSGIMAGQPFSSVLTGDPQLARRPMERVAEPLRRMGARIETVEGHAPLTIHGGSLHSMDYALPVASAQVKSCLLLAGLYAEGATTLREPGPARDHTERMLQAQIVRKPAGEQAVQGAAEPLSWGNGVVRVEPGLIDHLEPFELVVPGDFSSAAFPMAAAVLVPGSEAVIEGVGVNPTRTGLLDVLRCMGARIDVEREREQGGEPVADLVVRGGELHGTRVDGELVVRLIDEFPVLAVAATQASGETVVREASELRVKETDRIATVVAELQKLGAQIEPYADGFVVSGPTPLRGAVVHSYGDHRLGMALAVAGLVAEGETVVEDVDCIADSFPGFEELMAELE